MRSRFALPAWLREEAGRSIIELLTASAIAGMVTLMLGSIVILGLRFSRSSQLEDERIYPVRNAFDMITKDLRLTQGAYPDCGSIGRLALGIHGPGENEFWFAHYRREADGRLLRIIYADASCSATLSQQPIAYQIDDFSLTQLGAGQFEVLIRARSKDGTAFELTQTVTGRVLAQP